MFGGSQTDIHSRLMQAQSVLYPQNLTTTVLAANIL